MNKKITIIPAVLSPDFKDIAALINRSIGTTNFVQIDICDGILTDYLTWPFTKKGVPEIASDFEMPGWEDMNFEADMLVKNPSRYLESIKNIGFSKVVLHAGSEDEVNLIASAKELASYDIEVGLGITLLNDQIPDFALDLCDKLREHVIPFYIQIMGITKIGVQGQPFNEACLPAIKLLTENFPEIIIQVDGAVGDTNIVKLYEAGARSFVVGSWFTKSSLSVREGINTLKNLLY